MFQKMLNSQFLRYGSVGILNLTLSILIFNFFIWVTGVTRGIEVTFFSMITFAIVVTHSFFWNKFLVFKSSDKDHRREYAMFFTVSACVSLVNVGVISFLINGMGAPMGLSEHLWANVALILTIPISVLGNFFGYKLFVFRKASNTAFPIENEVI